MQHSLLSDSPVVDGLELVVRYRPAGRCEVGGDRYDVFPLDSDWAIAIVVGDVVGHDIAVAGAMGQLRASLRAVAVDHSARPADVVDRLDRINTQLVVADGSSVLLSQAVGGALIQMPTEARRDADVILPVGATLLLYTDGLVDAVAARSAKPSPG